MEQSRQLQELGCDRGQGYLFARPLAAEAVAEALSIPMPRPSGHDTGEACASPIGVGHTAPPAPW